MIRLHAIRAIEIDSSSTSNSFLQSPLQNLNVAAIKFLPIENYSITAVRHPCEYFPITIPPKRAIRIQPLIFSRKTKLRWPLFHRNAIDNWLIICGSAR